MALDYFTLKHKGKLYKNYSDGSSEEFIDLLTPTAQHIDIKNSDLIIVNEYYVARPDLISLAVYGSDEYTDLLCKYNGISNPFEVNENDIIYIPEMWQLQNIRLAGQKSSEIVENNKNVPISQSRKISTEKSKSERRSPAQAVEGDKNFVIDRSLGVVFY